MGAAVGGGRVAAAVVEAADVLAAGSLTTIKVVVAVGGALA